MPEVSKDPKSEDNASVPSSKETTNGLGGVAEFRKTLANLSRQLEIDRLAFLHKSLEDRGDAVHVVFSDGESGDFDLVVGADGVYSDTRQKIMPDAEKPEFTGQSVWRYNFTRPDDLNALHVYNGPTGIGLVPISEELMYMYVTTPEPDNPHYPREGCAEAMRKKLAKAPPQIQELAQDSASQPYMHVRILPSTFC